MKIAFYGTLMRGFDAQRRLGVEKALRYEAPCSIAGALFDLGPYPGLAEGEGEAAGEVFTVLDDQVLIALDDFEGAAYDRRLVTLLEPSEEAWVYFYVAALEGFERVPSGCWRTHVNNGRSRSS